MSGVTGNSSSGMLHGGEIYTLEGEVLDFSVNINPLGLPTEVEKGLKEALPAVLRYPDRSCGRLVRLLAEKTGVAEEHILCGNGASELLSLTLIALRPKRTLLCAPSFSGYLHALSAAGGEAVYHSLREEKGFVPGEELLSELSALSSGDLVILCSPANPVGNLIPEGLLSAVLSACEKKGLRLLLDECFIGFLQEEEQLTFRKKVGEHLSLIVLDAFTKRYAMPGIRLGYMMCSDRALLERLRRLQPEWSVSSLAQEAGVLALNADAAYLEKARRLIGEGRREFAEKLTAYGFTVYPGAANYVFFRSNRLPGGELFSRLLQKGILIRSCANYEGLDDRYFRAAILLPEKNARLLEALGELSGGVF